MSERSWPECDECGSPADTVHASPKWEFSGLQGDGSPARFFCPDHGHDNPWYWLLLRPMRGANDGASLRDASTIHHVWGKTWGPAFLSWLFNGYEIWYGMPQKWSIEASVRAESQRPLRSLVSDVLSEIDLFVCDEDADSEEWCGDDLPKLADRLREALGASES